MRNLIDLQPQELPIQFDPIKTVETMGDSFECVMGGVDMTPLPRTFRAGRFSLDARYANGYDSERKISLNTVA